MTDFTSRAIVAALALAALANLASAEEPAMSGPPPGWEPPVFDTPPAPPAPVDTEPAVPPETPLPPPPEAYAPPEAVESPIQETPPSEPGEPVIDEASLPPLETPGTLAVDSPTVTSLPGNTLVITLGPSDLAMYFDAGGTFANNVGGGGAWSVGQTGGLCLDYDSRGGTDACIGLPTAKGPGDIWRQSAEGGMEQQIAIVEGQNGRPAAAAP